MRRLNPAQKYETKIGAIIAIRNLIKESNIDDPMILSYLIDAATDPDKEVRKMLKTVVKEIIYEPNVRNEVVELLEIKHRETNSKIKDEIKELLDSIK